MNAVSRKSRMLLRGTAVMATLALLASVLPQAAAQADDLVNIPDTALRRCISTSLKAESLPDTFTAANLAKLDKLDCFNLNTPVTNLAGLESLTGLTQLRVPQLKAADLTPLTALSGLISVDIGTESLTDFDALASLTHVEWLGLWAPQATNLAFVSSLPDLTTVVLHVQAQADLSPLESRTKLRWMELLTPGAAALKELAHLDQLDTLFLIWDSPTLAGLALPDNLTTLILSDTYLTDIDDLPHSASVTTLKLLAEHLSRLDAIKNLPNLASLDLSSTRLTDLHALAPLNQLRQLRLGFGGTITSLEPLAGHALTALDVSRNRITSLEPLRGMPLTTLNVAKNQVTSLEPLRGMPLTTLDVGHNAVTSLEPLEGMLLTTLNVADNHVTSLEPLRGMPLTSLDAAVNEITSVDPLHGMSLVRLGMSHNSVSDVRPLTSVASHASVELEYNHIKDFSPLPDDVAASISWQTVTVAQATVGKPFDLGLRSVTGTPLCATFTPSAPCTGGKVTFPRSGTYQVWGPFEFTQYAGPNRHFAPVKLKLFDAHPCVGDSAVATVSRHWNPTPQGEVWQWYRDGKLIGSTSSSGDWHDITVADFTHRLRACVTVSRDGFDTMRVCSPASHKVVAGDISSVEPRVRGGKKVGSTLTGVYSAPVPGAKMTYRWIRDRHPIAHATHSTYRLTAADRGHRISLRVHVKARGYWPANFESPRYRVR